jgi:major membrane immunogen (membrane-anchored lipoprotein)
MKKIFMLCGMLMLSACSADDKYFWTDQKMKPPLVNEEGTFIDGDAHAKVGQYSGFGDIMQKYRGLIKGSIVSKWRHTYMEIHRV